MDSLAINFSFRGGAYFIERGLALGERPLASATGGLGNGTLLSAPTFSRREICNSGTDVLFGSAALKTFIRGTSNCDDGAGAAGPTSLTGAAVAAPASLFKGAARY